MEKIIMVVDDQKDERKLVRLLLRKYNCQVIEVPNPADAVRLAKQHKPHIILMDHMMPQMTGYECIAALRQESELCRIPIIMLSARKFDSGWASFMRMSIEDFLPKPVEAGTLLARLQSLLGPFEIRPAAVAPPLSVLKQP
jgi:CheY-like chemotaxis protein